LIRRTITIEDTFLFEIRDKASMAAIYDLWDSYDLGIKYKKLDMYIKMRKDTESKNGIPKNIEEIKEIISKMLLNSDE
jgi:hypothetical protein